MLVKLNEPGEGEDRPKRWGSSSIVVEYDPELSKEMEEHWRWSCDNCGRVAIVPSEETLAAEWQEAWKKRTEGMEEGPIQSFTFPDLPPRGSESGRGWLTAVGGDVLSSITIKDVDVLDRFLKKELDFCSFGCLADWAANAERYVDEGDVPPAP
jgi:hypothetical protein